MVKINNRRWDVISRSVENLPDSFTYAEAVGLYNRITAGGKRLSKAEEARILESTGYPNTYTLT